MPSHKFEYYDTTLTWNAVGEVNNLTLLNYQDDFGYYWHNPNNLADTPRDEDGRMWSLKKITYPTGGRLEISYENDYLSNTALSYARYYLGSYSTQSGNFVRARQGGPRVTYLKDYDGYNDTSPYITQFSYGSGHYPSIPELWYRKNSGLSSAPLHFSGERGQASVTYEWVEKKLPDNSRIKTTYETGGTTHTPEKQIHYVLNNWISQSILQENTSWNWGEVNQVAYFANSGASPVKEEINYWEVAGEVHDDGGAGAVSRVAPTFTADPAYNIYLYWEYKRLDSTVVKHYWGTNAVKSKEEFTYNDGSLIAQKTETAGDGKIRKTEYVYAHDLTSPVEPYTTMKLMNMRRQVAQINVKDNNASNNGYGSLATTWQAHQVDDGLPTSPILYVPYKEFRWRNNSTPATIPSFNWSSPDTTIWIRTQTFLEYEAQGNLERIHDTYGSETSIYWDVTGTLIDSMKTRPNATTTLTTKYAYDPNTFNLISATDPNGQKTEYKYDPLQRLIQTIMPDKRAASELAYYYSRQGAGNNDTFNATDPNYVKTRALAGAEFFEAFEYSDAPENHGWGVHFNTSPGTMATVYDNTLQSRVLRVDVTTGGNEGYAVKYPYSGELNAKSKHLWAKIKSTLGNSSFRVVVVRGGLEYSLRYYFDNGTNTYSFPNATFYLGAAFKDGAWHTLERDLEQDFKLTGLSTSYDYIRRIVAVGEYDLDQIQLQNHPVTSFLYADGLGRGIQTLQYDSTGAIKAGTFYDALDRVVKVTKPFWHGNTKFVRVDSVIAYANSYHSTKHPVYHDSLGVNEFDAGNYAYAETDFFPDPLNRVRHQYAPGTVFSKADTNYVKYRYGTNLANEMGIANAASVFETRLFDENDVKTEIFTDTFGNKVAVRNDSSGANNNGNTSKLATAFQYDIVNNLTKIAPPKAFNIGDNNTPDWNSVFCTNMTYNSLSQLTSRQTPDADTTAKYLYDKKGNLRFVKEGKKDLNNFAYFIYYKYDNLGRKTEEGLVYTMSDFNQTKADDPIYPLNSTTWKVKYQYDISTYVAGAPQRHLKGRLCAIEYFTDRYPNMNGRMLFSYDDNGNVEWIEQHIPRSTLNDGNGHLVAKIDYQYDALGKVTKTYFRRTFPPGAASNAFYTWYDYDALGRLEKVFTATADVRSLIPNAQYAYWPGGQVKRLALGDSLQGVDYLYNSRDWLTQINHQNLYSGQDPGGDGANGFQPDRFGQVIGYNRQRHIATGHADFAAQFNGNISWTIHRTTGNTKPVAVGSNLTGWVFKYDKANRLTKANWGHYLGTSWQSSNRFDLTGMVYDRHGNLEYMTRYDTASVATNMDYVYTANTNKLNRVIGLNNQGANNYTYDAIGNMITDAAKLGALNTITYDYRNLPAQAMIQTNTLPFSYDGKGQRVSKFNLLYVPGLDGHVIAVYDDKGTLLYWNVWGLDLVGQRFWKQ